MTAVYSLFAFLFVLFAIYYYLSRSLTYWKERSVIGPNPIPFFGNLKESALRRKHVGVLYKEIYDDYPDEKYIGIYRMTTPSLIIRDLDIVKHILIKDFDVFSYRGFDFSKEGLGDNLFHASGDTWRAIKHKMTPYFTSEKMKNAMYLITERGDKFVDYLESICLKQKEQEVVKLFQKYTIATTMAFAFGINVETIHDNSEIFQKIDKSFFKTSYWNEMDMLFPGILQKVNLSLFDDLVNRFCYEIVEAVSDQRDGKPSAKNDLMDLMLALKLEGEVKSLKVRKNEDQACLKVTEHVIAGQVFVFYAAGYGNNSIVLSNTMFCLAINPEVQDKLVAEIEEVLQRYNGELTYEAIKEMSYLEYTFLETLRMHPTTNSIGRCAVKDYRIPGTDLTIEKGTSVVISPLAIQNDERIYPNPEKFDPERFTPENSKSRHSCAYLPFGAGPRTCLGGDLVGAMAVVYSLFALLSIIYAIYYYLSRSLTYWKERGVIGPNPIPFFGNLKESALRRKHVGVLYKEIYDDYPDEKYIGIYRMTTPSLIIRDLDIAKHILIKDFDVFSYRGFDFSKEGLGDNLFHASGDTWRAIKHKMTPYFTSDKMKNAMYLLTESGDKFIDYLESICVKQKEQELIKLFQKYTIATTMAFTFGINVETIHDNSEIFQKIDKSFFKTSYWNEMDMLFPGILQKVNLSLFDDLVNRFCYEIVEAANNHRDGKPSAKTNLMDLMLALKLEGEVKSLKGRNNEDQACLKVTEHVIAGQVFVFYAAGCGNNSIILSNTMFCLAINPEVQDKLVAEIDEVLQRYNGELTYEAIKEMSYLECTFLETLRMHPTTNSIGRCAVKDYRIPGTDLTIEKGTSVVISALAIQNDESVYPNPEKFDPERFTPENSKSRHSCAYLPFGAGPRACLGIRFAKIQYKVCVIKILRKFRIEPSGRTKHLDNTNPCRTLMSRDGGIYLNFVPRECRH